MLYAKFVWEQLRGLSAHYARSTSRSGLRTIKESCAVIVPMLSLNTLSKLALLLADNLASNILLHALFAGKPVLLARNGVDPSDKGRDDTALRPMWSGVAAAIEERLRIVSGYGCQITDVGQLSNALTSLLELRATFRSQQACGTEPSAGPLSALSGSIVTAADVLQAHHSGAQLRLAPRPRGYSACA